MSSPTFRKDPPATGSAPFTVTAAVVGARAIGSASAAARRQGLTRRLLGIDLTDGLGDVRVPVLVLAGAADRVVPRSKSKRVCTSLPGARLEEFAGAGHMLPVERSARVADGEPCQLVT